MNFWNKKNLNQASLLLSGFCLIVIVSVRMILGLWHPFLYGFLVFLLAGLMGHIFWSYKFYLDFLSIKTAKKGLSLGWSFLILIVFLSAISYLGNRFNRSLDLTEEGINSLSEQSQSALKTLTEDLTFYIFYKGGKISPQSQAIKQDIKNNLSLYKQNSPRIKTLFLDSYKNNLKAEKYLSDLPDKNDQEIFVFAQYKDRKIRAEAPFAEESLTSAIIKAQKREFKEILFLTGHGEKSLNNEKPSGLKILKKSLEDSGFILKEWNFIQNNAPQNPPALIINAGPRKPFLDLEKTYLKSYLEQGGSLLLALDPKEKHALQDFLKSYGLIFKDDFVLSQIGLLYGGITKALGVELDPTHPISRQMKGQAVFFEKASSISIQPSTFEKFKVSQLVKSHRQSFAVPELKEKIKVGQMDSLNLAVELSKKESAPETSKKKPSESKDKPFRLLLFGDSDFLSNRYIYEGANKDLILNAVVFLTGEEELVSIRPKQPKGTKLSLNRPEKVSLILFYIVWTLVFLLTGFWIWFRRREA